MNGSECFRVRYIQCDLHFNTMIMVDTGRQVVRSNCNLNILKIEPVGFSERLYVLSEGRE